MSEEWKDWSGPKDSEPYFNINEDIHAMPKEQVKIIDNGPYGIFVDYGTNGGHDDDIDALRYMDFNKFKKPSIWKRFKAWFKRRFL